MANTISTKCDYCDFDVAAALREPIPLRAWLRHPLHSLAVRWRRWLLDTPLKNRAALVVHVLITHGESTAVHSLSPSAIARWSTT